MIPLLIPSYRRVKKKDQYIGILNVNENFIRELVKQAEKKDSLFLHLDRSLPMIYRPADWYNYEIGGYYKRPTNLMRIHETKSQEQALKYADLTQVFRVLNAIS